MSAPFAGPPTLSFDTASDEPSSGPNVATEGVDKAELELFSGRKIDVPSIFIAGKNDWGIYQVPGSIERMQGRACTRMLGCILIDGAGHWVQQEQSERVSKLLMEFLAAARSLDIYADDLSAP